MNKKKDYPKFMKWTHEVPLTKNGKERPREDIEQEKEKIAKRIDNTIICPMNWLEECLDRIQGVSRNDFVETYEYLVDRPPGKPKAT